MAEERITFVTPFMTVVLPVRETAGLTGIVVAPEMTRSDVPEITVGEAVMGDAPIKEAIAEAMAAWEEEAGGVAVGDEGGRDAAGALGEAEFGDEGGKDAAAGALGDVDGEGACTVGLFGEGDAGFAAAGDEDSEFGS